jgi:phage shock protein C
MENNSPKQLYKSKSNRMISGVCGGLGEYFNVDPVLVRLAFVLLCIFAGGGLLAYIVALIIVPEAPEGYVPPAQTAAPQPEAAPAADASTPKTKEKAESADPNNTTLI